MECESVDCKTEQLYGKKCGEMKTDAIPQINSHTSLG